MKKLISDVAEWVKKNRLITALAILLVFTVLVMACKTYGGDKDSVYKFLRDLASGLLVAIGAVALLRRADSQDEIAKATLQSNEQTIFKDGLAFLGNDSESVRLGGIYNLHELAVKKPERSDDVLEILCAHLRSKTNEEDYQKNCQSRPSVEISSLLRLLTNEESELRKACEGKGGGGYTLNFRGAFLNGMVLPGAWLKEANLREAQMQGANLSGAQMQDADLSGAQMQDADLSGAQMQDADLSGAQMQGSHLLRAQMPGAHLLNAQMQGAALYEVKMQGADLRDTQMRGARLSAAQMQGANFSNAQMQGVVLYEVSMQGAALSSAQMQGAVLYKADMQGAYLSEAQMQGADLSWAWMQGADLRDTQMQGAILYEAKMQGANLYKTQMQGANLSNAQMQGAMLDDVNLCGASDSIMDFSKYEHMKLRRGKDTEINEVIFSGGLDREYKERIEKTLQKDMDEYPALKKKLNRVLKDLQNLAVDTKPSCEIPEGVITGIWDEKEADKTIEEYKKAMAWKKKDADESD